jgi:NAD(P)H-dependent flavin oxidoreductase YrpB (nitropropane dioxygenase family)
MQFDVYDTQQFVNAPAAIDYHVLRGQCVGLVREIKPAGEIVSELVYEAEQIFNEKVRPSVN